LAEFSLFEFLQKLLRQRPANRWLPRSRPSPTEQPLDAFFNHRVPISENRLTAYPSDLHDFSNRVFVLRNQSHHQQALARPVWLRLAPRCFYLLDNLLAQFWKCSHQNSDFLRKSKSCKVLKLLGFGINTTKRRSTFQHANLILNSLTS